MDLNKALKLINSLREFGDELGDDGTDIGSQLKIEGLLAMIHSELKAMRTLLEKVKTTSERQA